MKEPENRWVQVRVHGGQWWINGRCGSPLTGRQFEAALTDPKTELHDDRRPRRHLTVDALAVADAPSPR